MTVHKFSLGTVGEPGHSSAAQQNRTQSRTQFWS
jgi:hypothetical protein